MVQSAANPAALALVHKGTTPSTAEEVRLARAEGAGRRSAHDA